MTGRTVAGQIPLVFVLCLMPSVTLGDPVGKENTTDGRHVSVSGGSQKATANLVAVGQIGGLIEGIAVQDSIAYVTVGPRLISLQVSETGSLTELGGTPAFPRFLRDVTVAGDYAYVATGEAGIAVVDVSDPAHPIAVGSWDSPGYAEAVTIVGGVLYVADGPYGLRVVDVTDPAAPVEVGWAFPLSYALDVAVAGSVAAIASVTAGLLIADVSDPADPVEQGSLSTNGCALGVAIDGGTVYLADGWGGLVSVDISAPGAPEEMDSFQTPGWAMGVAVADGVALVADGFKGLRVLDISTPTALAEIGALGLDGHAVNVVASGSRALLVDRPSTIRVIDLTDTSNPAPLSVFASIGQVEDVSVSGMYAYLASGDGGMAVVEIADPSAPRQVAQIDTQGLANNVATVGNHVFVTTIGGPEGLEILDISDPAHPFSVSFFPQGHGPYRDLEISGSIAFIPDEGGLVALDVSDPAHPFETGWIDLREVTTHGATAGVSVQGTLAAVAQEQDGMVFVDVADPTDMAVHSRFHSGDDWALNVTLQGNLAYVADLGLRVLDVSDPENPQEIGFVPSSEGNGRDVILDADAAVAYLTHGSAGVLAFDVSNPQDPILIAGYDTLGSAEKGVMHDGLTYVADRGGGLLILEALPAAAHHAVPPGVCKRPERQHVSTGSDAWVPTTSGGGRTADVLPSGPSGSGSSRSHSGQLAEGLREGGTGAPRMHPLRPGDVEKKDSPRSTARAAGQEGRKAANTCQVTTTADSGPGSLRWCMEHAESGDTIAFDPAVFPPGDPAEIVLSSELPEITQGGVTIDASESGVILDGQDGPYPGIVIFSDANTVRGLQIYSFGDIGIAVLGNSNVIGGDRALGAGPVGQGNVCSGNYFGIDVYAGSSDNIVAGNLVGTDVTGRLPMGNSGHGIHVAGHDNLIGGTEPGERNIVSANGEAGIALHFFACVGNRVIGNYAGTDIDGATALGNAGYGIGAEQGPAGNLIEGNLASGNGGAGIVIVDAGSSYNSVVGNIVGLDAAGTRALENGASGVYVGLSSAWFNRVGGSVPEERNVVSGNQRAGITVAGAAQFVLGNYVGTDVTGTQAVGNDNGIILGLAENSFVGGTREEERNVISGNANGGVEVVLAFSNVLMGNFIGVAASGTAPLPNGEGVRLHGESQDNVLQGNVISGNDAGVVIRGGAERNILRANRIGVAAGTAAALGNQQQGIRVESASNRIGGPFPEDGNIIANNEGDGVQVWNHSGSSVRGNSIYANNGLGIDLCADFDVDNAECNDLTAVTPNDPDDPDAGANNLQNFPILTVQEGVQTVVGTLDSIALSEFTLDFYASSTCDPSGYGEGEIYLGSDTVTTDASGDAAFVSTLAVAVPAGWYVTATATDTEGSTSELSPCLEIVDWPLFADGFESAATSAWSVAVP